MKCGLDLPTWRYDPRTVFLLVVISITFFSLLFMSLLSPAADIVDGQQNTGQNTLGVVAVWPANSPPYYSLDDEGNTKSFVQWHDGLPVFWTVERVLISMGVLALLCMVVMFIWRYVSLSKINRQLHAVVKAHKETKNMLNKSEDRVRLLLDSTTEAIYGIDTDGRCTFANQCVLDMTGYSEEEIYETGIKDLIHPDQYEFVLSQFKRRMAGEKVQKRYETVFVNKLGKNIPVELTAAKTLWQGRPAGLTIVHDISKRKLEEAELVQHREHLQERVEERTRELNELKNARDETLEAIFAKSAFLAKMSHELRTPLNSIIGFSGLIKDGIAGPVNEEQKKQLGMVFDSAQHLLRLINDVLDLSKIEAGKVVVSKSPFLLEPMLAELQDMLYLQADRKDLSLHVEASKAPQVLFTDQSKIKQVLVNLLSNAVKFTERGAVTLSCWQQKKAVCFSVKDTGIGINRGQLEEVFNAFHQEHRADARQHQGTGLGLTICKEFVALLGGEISAQSEPGRGSVFTVRLPNAVVESEIRKQTV